MKASSLHGLANRVLNTLPMEAEALEDLCFDSLWRLGDWSQITNSKINSTSEKVENFFTYHFKSLKNLYENDNSSLYNCLKQAHMHVIKELGSISLESCKAVYPKLCQLQMLREIEEFASADSEDYADLLVKKYVFNNNNFQNVEPILAQRAVLFKIKHTLKENTLIKNALIDLHLKTAKLAQQEGNLGVAARSLGNIIVLSLIHLLSFNILL